MPRLARIHRPQKSAMQSGRANARDWVLEFEPAAARFPDPLMGWTQSTDMDGQVRLTFENPEEAVAYANRRGLAFELLPDPKKVTHPKAYADNFSYTRKVPWTH